MLGSLQDNIGFNFLDQCVEQQQAVAVRGHTLIDEKMIKFFDDS